jgi:replicative DNA helicase
MSKNTIDDSLSENSFGISETFQDKIIANLILDEKFLEQIISHIKIEYFDTDYHQWVFQEIRDYFNNFNKGITRDALFLNLKNRRRKININNNLKGVKLLYEIFDGDASKFTKDCETIKQATVDFCRRQEMKNALLYSVEDLQRNDIDSVYKRIEEAYNTGISHDIGLDLDDVEDRTTNTPRKNILPLPFEALNKKIGGGIGEGEFVALIAPMGTGKSMWAANVVAHAKKTNSNAILYTLEMEEAYNRMRIDSILLDRKTDELHDASIYLDDIRQELSKYTGKVFVKRYGDSEVTALTLKSHIRMMKAKGIHPDWVVIDYMDIMDTIDIKNRYKQDWEKFEVISRDLARLAVSEGVRIFGLAQGNTQSIDKSIITAQNTSGGAKRLHPCHLILGYARTDKDKQNDVATLSFIKSRFGSDGFTMPVVTDYSKCYIEVQNSEVLSLTESHEPEDFKEKWRENYKKKFKKPKATYDDDGLVEFK